MITTIAEYHDPKVMIGLFRHDPPAPEPRSWRLVHSGKSTWQQDFGATYEVQAHAAFERDVADHLGLSGPE